jgi:hypothetical protein
MRMIYLVGVVLVVIAGPVLLLRALRRFAWRAPQPPSQPSFDMVELQSMLDKGLISREEFERLQGLIMAERPLTRGGEKAELTSRARLARHPVCVPGGRETTGVAA